MESELSNMTVAAVISKTSYDERIPGTALRD